MDGGVIAAQEEAHKQQMMQQVLSTIFLKLKVVLRTNVLNFGEPPCQIFGGKKLLIGSKQGISTFLMEWTIRQLRRQQASQRTAQQHVEFVAQKSKNLQGAPITSLPPF